MKKTLTVLILILVGLFLCLSVLGRKGEYAAEKAMHKVNKLYVKIQKDPLATPEAEFDRVVQMYKSFLKKHPDSKLAPFAHILIARTFVLKQDFDMARSTLERIIQQYDDKPNMAAQALLEIAATYSRDENIPAVLSAYERLKRDFPLTEQGLKAPFTLAKLESGYVPNITERVAFERAIQYYRGLAVKYPNSGTSFKALYYIGSCHMYTKNWRPALNVYSEILLTYTGSQYLTPTTLSILIKTINTISVAELNDYDYPVKIYSQFITKFPDHPASPVLESVIKGMKELKRKSMEGAGNS